MKQAIKNIIGAGKARKIAQFRKAARISTNRFIRTISSGKKFLPSPQTQTFALPDAHVFFGYYDVPQFSCDENLILATAAPLINTTPSPDHFLKLGFFDLGEERPQFQKFATTNTWCWQQGSRLQWYPFESKSIVLYNALIEGRYGCVIQDVHSGEVIRSFQRPIYVVSRDGEWGLSLNFSRLQGLRPGYGYNVLPNVSQNDPKPDDDGIWRIDMETGEDNLLFSVRDIAELKMDETATSGRHYFNHLLFNINGDQFMFFHILQLPDGGRKIRMFTAKSDGTDIHLVNDSGHVSHYCWRGDNELLCYSTVAGRGEGYYLYRVDNGDIQTVGAGTLKEDGHPSFLPGGQILVTDTYPDKFGESSLLLYNLENAKLIPLYRTFIPAAFNGETRCDLHPRVSHSGRFICIDCIESGKRVMKLIDVSKMASECSAA